MKTLKERELKMISWDYVDTELPFNSLDRLSHMKSMGSKGWELVSVSSNPVNACHVYFWKRPVNEGVKEDLPTKEPLGVEISRDELNTEIEEKKLKNSIVVNHDKGSQKISASYYKKFPEPQVVMVVKYRPKDNCFEDFRKELYRRDYPNVIARHMGFNKEKEFVCISFMENIDAALDLEGVGTQWLDSVDHLLIKYPDGSRTESFSGPVWGWFPQYENLKKYESEIKAFTVLVVKIKNTQIEEVKNLILQPSKAPNKLFTCIAQYRDTDDTYIHIGLDTLKDKINANKYFMNSYDKLINAKVIPEMSREFFSDAEDFVWFNTKYLE